MTVEEYRKKKKDESRRKSREKNIKEGRCRDCGKEDAFTIIGRTRCADCVEKERLAKKRDRQDEIKREFMRLQQKTVREKRIERGECPRCGRKYSGPHKTCDYCRANGRNRKRDMNREKAATRGWSLCYQCNKKEPLEGYKLCSECYEKKVKICEMMNKINFERKYGFAIDNA